MANQVSFLRILLVPAFVFLFLASADSGPGPDHRMFAAAVIFIIAAITDLVDGYLARNYEKVTRLGKLIDPVADKILVTAGLLCLLDARIIGVWVALLLIGRDIAVQGLRLVAAGRGEIISASGGGKLKTVLQMATIIIALVVASAQMEMRPGGWLFELAGTVWLTWIPTHGITVVTVLAWLSVVSSFWSAWDYFQLFGRMAEE